MVRGVRGIALLFLTKAVEEVRGQRQGPAALYPGKDPATIVQEAGWAPGPIWTGAKNLHPPGFEPRTVQPVASRYTDYSTRPTIMLVFTPNLYSKEIKCTDFISKFNVVKSDTPLAMHVSVNTCGSYLKHF